MFKKRVVAAAACALAMAGAAHAVEVSRDGTGDLLIAPAYFIGGGMTTDLKVVNTSKTQSVVAKVVFRDQTSSAELLDFLIYLSPSDVWTGTMSCETADAAGTCVKSVITSADDSIQLVNSNTFASATNPVEIVNELATTGRQPLPNQGYVEVLMGSAYDVTPFKPGVKKENIVLAHEAAAELVAVNATPNVLTGSVTAHAPGMGAATLPLLALADYNNNNKIAVGNVSGFDLPTQRTPIADVEEALWTNNIAVPYVVGDNKLSLVTFTFPTKLTYNNRQDGQYAFRESPADNWKNSCTNVSAEVFNNSEESLPINLSPLPANKCLKEFQWLVFGSDILTDNGVNHFTEGWARLTFDAATAAVAQVVTPADSTNVGRLGVPAIATYMQKDETANKFTWAYATSAR
ncbi:MAG: hypothetical protein PHX60_00515 [Giesbergeria sp.]|uniref:hypothetical protein n=1 Tax=Giesbergeria sp. TaxID=2818473 RepID=UPI00260721DB|nr:hypothetical protein [Giesbergeria sp.]MDD2608164.1 hypothetical protein [Giesbergeria sp.]